ncbi:STAS domain-containing protein [Streptomyces sp. NPDC015127]|uniref:STAS domain-containing protein n=1 Tax=Streptomyces sp. NPDC015127 TaxID=3364939 RepID=UPI0036FB6704
MQPIVMRIAGRVAPGDAPRLCEELSALLRDDGTTAGGDARGCRPEVVVCDVGGLAQTSLAVVDALARLQLTARRHGTRIRLRNAPPELVALLDLVGLVELVELGEAA